jgi:hypothetical protein
MGRSSAWVASILHDRMRSGPSAALPCANPIGWLQHAPDIQQETRADDSDQDGNKPSAKRVRILVDPTGHGLIHQDGPTSPLHSEHSTPKSSLQMEVWFGWLSHAFGNIAMFPTAPVPQPE